MTEEINFGKYILGEQLGRGGFGTIYRAEDTSLHVERAVKILHPAFNADPVFIERFRQEARTAARLDHPNIVPVYDLGQYEGALFLVMRLMPGGSLKNLLEQEGHLPPERAVVLLFQIAAGLDFAHSLPEKLVHRDIKPGNILLEQDGTARISDFGFSKALEGASSVSLSATGGMVGTPPYMAPELWRGQAVGPATDIYSLACLLFEMLSGRALFTCNSPAQVMTHHVLDGPNFDANWPAGIPESIRPVLERALAGDPAARFPTATAFAEGVQAAFESPGAPLPAEAEQPQEVPAEAPEPPQREETPAPIEETGPAMPEPVHAAPEKPPERSTEPAAPAPPEKPAEKKQEQSPAPQQQPVGSPRPAEARKQKEPQEKPVLSAAPEGSNLAQPAAPRPEPATERKTSFLGSTRGRLIIAAGSLITLILCCGVIFGPDLYNLIFLSSSPADEAPETAAEEPVIGDKNSPIRIILPPFWSSGSLIDNAQILADALTESTGYVYEIIDAATYSEQIFDMCDVPERSIGFLTGESYVIAKDFCGVDAAFTNLRYYDDVFRWVGFYALRESGIDSVFDLDGKSWAYRSHTSQSYMVPFTIFKENGITPGTEFEKGAHPEALIALLEGHADFATAFYHPYGAQDVDIGWRADQPDIPPDFVSLCGPNLEAEGIFCGKQAEYQVLDARRTLMETVPDIIELVKVFDISPNLPNEAIAFSPEFPASYRSEIETALQEIAATETWEKALTFEFYASYGIEITSDDMYDFYRQEIAALGLDLQTIDDWFR